LVTGQQLGALGYGRVAQGDRLRLGRLLSRLLRHRALFDPDQGLAVRAVQDVHPAGAAGFGDSLARLAVDDGVEDDERARGIVIPDVVMDLLEVPDRKSTRLNSSHVASSYAVFCLKKKKANNV